MTALDHETVPTGRKTARIRGRRFRWLRELAGRPGGVTRLDLMTELGRRFDPKGKKWALVKYANNLLWMAARCGHLRKIQPGTTGRNGRPAVYVLA